MSNAVYGVSFGIVFEGSKRCDVGSNEQSKTVAAKDAEDAIRRVRIDAKREWIFGCDEEGNFTKKKLKAIDIVVGSVEKVSDLDIA